jgi:periplasmic protein TonB
MNSAYPANSSVTAACHARMADVLRLPSTSQDGYGTRNLSSFAIVVALHAALGAAMLLGMPRTTIMKAEPPPVTVIPPQPPVVEPTPPVKIVPPTLSRPVISTFVDVPILPPIQSTTQDSVTVPTVTTPSSIVSDTPSSTRGDTVVVTTQPASRDVGVMCPNAAQVQAGMRYPADARREGIAGDVVARFVVGSNGAIRDIAIVSSSHRLLNRSVLRAVEEFRCHAQGGDVLVEAPFSFRLE